MKRAGLAYGGLVAVALIAFWSIVLLAGCATQPPTAQLATACNALASAYLTAAGYKAQGKLSPDQIDTLVKLEPVAIAACDKAHPPTDTAAALNAALDAAQRIALVNAGVK